ncbi:60S ribosomal protein L19-3, putative [Trichomonas vaginalis G3]|uniref:60S ribosomal protein L19-3, putative n=1 Tax=Trichomonas vaginalis (strain ATCC PRA-98 / G3) TaxID=412133 RepID=A2D8G1_TRIV3|nr:structural constituent of ribosome [Trichomonas vaginalis G3]XP_001584196.1 structural constituent of ribosome [Trichomonas vaginalis G3]XP_001584197.1 structural constituent of ribosome [Trichomonas vaginalis G3]XP_001584198.1 structural constituent of ribosome [Trichomonas vaginalis G3]5XY3_R Chain R, 60S ribosomal protein L19-3, putative [Trichomonas vaginalis]EAY11542.1 60S ribosomal protein L19-3, putative [Trichomonas vaginalis G3]EAY23210.1 60S ribosomal protein L19-3, putative [Tri|eukprot:XP_001323765.1 60S ribosomal protein L19-3 [Trichomonas vaginalis G3]
MSSLKLQKRLAASVLDCGVRRVWMDDSEVSTIAMANSRQQIRKLINDGIIVKRPVKVHSGARHTKRILAKRLGRHTGYGKRRGGRNARLTGKFQWIRRIRVLRKVLVDYRKRNEIDCHLYRKLYLKAKGNEFRNRRNLVEHIQTLKAENLREKTLQSQIDARRARSRRVRERKNGVSQ